MILKNECMLRAVNFLAIPLTILVIFLYVFVTQKLRELAMREFARRWELRYTRGTPNRWPWTKADRLPHGLKIKGTPANLIRNTWNILDGEIQGNRVVIFDSLMGSRLSRGWYSTVVAVRTRQNPFSNGEEPEKVSIGTEWKLLYRHRFLQIGWTLSIERLDVIMGSLLQVREQANDKQLPVPEARLLKREARRESSI
jgi:hypothetical protein